MIEYEDLKKAFKKVNLHIKMCNGKIYNALYAIHIDKVLNDCIHDIEKVLKGSSEPNKSESEKLDYIVAEKYGRTFIKIQPWTELNNNLKLVSNIEYDAKYYDEEIGSDESMHLLMDAYEYEGSKNNFFDWLDSNGY